MFIFLTDIYCALILAKISIISQSKVGKKHNLTEKYSSNLAQLKTSMVNNGIL
jgi:hypothetical protein